MRTWRSFLENGDRSNKKGSSLKKTQVLVVCLLRVCPFFLVGLSYLSYQLSFFQTWWNQWWWNQDTNIILKKWIRSVKISVSFKWCSKFYLRPRITPQSFIVRIIFPSSFPPSFLEFTFVSFFFLSLILPSHDGAKYIMKELSIWILESTVGEDEEDCRIFCSNTA